MLFGWASAKSAPVLNERPETAIFQSPKSPGGYNPAFGQKRCISFVYLNIDGE